MSDFKKQDPAVDRPDVGISRSKLLMYLADLELTYSPGWGKTGDGDAKIYEFVKGLSAEIAGWETVPPLETEMQQTCNDAISREAALKVADDVEDKWIRGQIDLMYAPMVQGLKALPAVMPVASPVEYEACEDAVSRQAAIDILDGLQTAHEQGLNEYAEHRKRMCELPPVTPAAKGGTPDESNL